MRPLRAAATALVAVLALSGCDGGSDPADPSPTAQPSASSSEPSTTPATEKPVEPVLPPAATKATEAGARAFITYYWDLINYAQASGNAIPLKSVSAPTCAICSGFVKDLNDLYEAGGWLVGGANNATITEIAELSTKDKKAYGFRVELDVSHDAQTIIDGNGAEDDRKAGMDKFTAFLLWVDNTYWRTDALDLH